MGQSRRRPRQRPHQRPARQRLTPAPRNRPGNLQRRILTALILLLLTLAVAAEDPRRAWLLTMDDFRANWPAHYRVKTAREISTPKNSRIEKFRS